MACWNKGPCRNRSKQHEWIDTPDISDPDLLTLFSFIESTEKLTGGSNPILNFLKKESRLWPKGRCITILDIYCGRGFLSRRIAKWAEKNKMDIRILAVDRYGRIINMAKEVTPTFSNLTFDVRDWNSPLFLQAQQFDYVISSQSLHHMDHDEAKSFFKTIDRLAKRGFIVCDWLRDIRAWFWMKSATKFLKEEAIQHDAPLAIEKGFTPDELLILAEKCELKTATIKTHLNHHFSFSCRRGMNLVGELSPTQGFAGT